MGDDEELPTYKDELPTYKEIVMKHFKDTHTVDGWLYPAKLTRYRLVPESIYQGKLLLNMAI